MNSFTRSLALKIKVRDRLLLWGIKLCLLAWLFSFSNSALASDDSFVITEVMYDPAQNSDGDKMEWVEMYAENNISFTLKSSDQIKDFYLCAKWDNSLSNCKNAYVVYSPDKITEIPKTAFVIFTKDPTVFRKNYLVADDAIVLKTSSSFNLLSDENSFIAYSLDNKKTWNGNVEYDDFFNKKREDYSLEKIDIDKDDSQGNWQESFEKGGSPGKNSTKPKVYSNKIIINEILPYPIDGEEEYVELYNSSEKDEDLKDWVIADKAGNECPLDGKIKSQDFFVAEKSVLGERCSLALNNSGEETVFLYDPNSKEVSRTEYKSAKENISYNFNSKDWRWSKFLTPDQENKFNNIPETKIKKDKRIYTNMYADFDAKVFDADGDKTKVTWHFGDGHKSYLKKTRHKYEKAGTYAASLKSSDGSEDKVDNFQVIVEDFPKRKVKITAISPNPEGKDSDLEWIEIKNESKKKVNLKDWSVATGWKNLYNHPINLDFIIEPGKTKVLTRAYSAFTLNNKKDKIELRYPDGEVADKLKYNKKKEMVADDEVYRKVKKKKWGWEKEKNNNTEFEVQENIQISEAPEILSDEIGATNPEAESSPVIVDDEIENENNVNEIENEINNEQDFLYSENNPFIQGKVLGVEIMNNNIQLYKSENKNRLEWSHSLFLKINSAINRIISLI